MLRSIGAVLGGFVAMAVLVMIGTAAAMAAFVPGGLGTMRSGGAAGGLPNRYLVANLTISFLAAVAGGTVTAIIAAANPRQHTLALAAFVLVMSVVSARQSAGHSATGGQPSWYSWVIAVIGVVGVIVGGMLRASS